MVYIIKTLFGCYLSTYIYGFYIYCVIISNVVIHVHVHLKIKEQILQIDVGVLL